MANSDKNIRITTSKNKTTYPNIVFTGSAAGSSVITLEVLDDNTLSFTSNEGQVFSIDSNLSTGTIWAVSDISGIPLLSSSAGGTIGLGVYGGVVAIGQTNPTYKLDLKGSFGLASSNDGLYNFIFSNSAASGSNSFSIRSANSILLYNSGNTFYTGLKSNAAANVTYTLPTTDGSSGQFLQTNGSGTLTWATATGGAGGGSTGVGSGGQYEVAYYPGTGSSVIGNANLKNNTATSVVSVSYTTASTDFNNGAFTVSGGVGIGGSLNVGGIGASISGVNISNSLITRGTWNGTIISTQYGGTGQNLSSSTGVLTISSGTVSASTTSSAIASALSDETGSGSLVFGTTPTFTTSVVTSDSTFAVFNTNATTINAFGAATTLSLGANTGTATFNSTNNTNAANTGSVVFSGGVGIGKSVSIGGRLLLFNGSTYTGFASSQVGTGSTVYFFPPTTPATGTSVLQSDSTGIMSWVPMVAASSGAGSGTVAIPGAQYQIAAYYAGTGASVSGSTTFTNNLASSNVNISHSTASISTNSGAFTVSGGVGIGGSLYTSTGSSSSISGVILANNTVSASTFNKVTITAPTSSATLTLADGSSLITSGANSLTLTTTAPTNITFPTTGTLVNTAVTSLSSLNTVGTITSGTWSASAITSHYGGTGLQTPFVVGDILYATTTTTWGRLAASSTSGQVLTSNGAGALPTWQAVPPAAASSVAVAPTTVASQFSFTVVNSASGTGLGLSTVASLVINPSTGLVSLSGLAVTATTVTTSSTTGALTVAGGAGIANSAFIGGMLRVGTNTFLKSYSVGDIALDNGSTADTPAVTHYWGNFTNIGTDVYTDGVGSTRYRVVYNLNESGGREVFTIDTNGNLRLYTSTGANYFGLRFTGSATTTYTLPASTPAGIAVSVLQSDQAGVMSWVPMTAGGGSGSVNSGSATFAVFYATNGTAVSDNANLQFTGTGLSVGGNVQSSSTLTGSLQVRGGFGITGNAFIGGTTVITNSTSSSSTVSGAITVTGGLGLAGNAFIGGTTNIVSSQTSISTNSGALVVSGGVGIGGSLYTATGSSSSISGVILANNTISASTYNKVTITAPASSATLTLADGSSLITSGGNSLTFTTTAPTNVTLPTSGTLVNTAVTSLSSLNTVGTITSGTWSASAITSHYGGTGLQTPFVVGDILYATTTTTWGRLAASSTSGQVLTSNGAGALPTWQAVPSSSATSVAVAPTAVASQFSFTVVNSASGTGLGLSTVASLVVNPNTGLVSLSGLAVTSTTATGTTSTGALTVAGGVGIGQSLFVGGSIYAGLGASILNAPLYTNNIQIGAGGNNINFLDASGATLGNFNTSNGWFRSAQTTESSSTGTGALVSLGGLGVAKNAFIGGTASVTSSQVSISSSSGALVVTGGVGIGGSLYTSTGSSSSVSGVILANGNVSASTYNRLTLTTPAAAATLTLANNSTLATSGANSLTLSTTNTTSVTLPTAGTLTSTGNNLGVFASTTSAQLIGIISDATGTAGKLVFSTSPTFTTSVLTDSASFNVFNTTATTVNAFQAGTAISLGAATGTLTLNNATTLLNQLTPSTSASTGALVVNGGVGIGLSASIGGRLQLFNGGLYTAFVSSQSGVNTTYILPPTSPSSIGASFLTSTQSGTLAWIAAPGGGGASPGGVLDGSIQYKSGSSFGGTRSVFYDTLISSFKVSGYPGTDVVSGANSAFSVEQSYGSFSGNINGTMVAVNSASGFIGSLLDLQVNNAKKFVVSYTGAVTFNNAFTFPTTDGSPNQVLQTNGSGTVSWATVSSSGAGSGTVAIPGAQYQVAAYYWSATGASVSGSSTFTNNTATANVNISHTTPSNSTSTGALTVAGSVGVGGSLYVGGQINQTFTPSTGAAIDHAVFLQSNPIPTTIGALIQIGSANKWDGTTAGYFTGSANGTFIGINAASGNTSDFITFQENGTTVFSVGAGGTNIRLGQALGYIGSNVLGTFVSTVDSYNQLVLQNKSAGTNASANLVVNNNLSTDTAYYGEIGINSSNFSGTGALAAPNATYVAATTGPLVLGTTTQHPIRFVVNGGATDVLYISEGGTAISCFTNFGMRGATDLRFWNSGNTFYAAFQGGNNTVNYIMTLPTAPVATGSSLILSGSDSQLYFVAPGGGIAFSAANSTLPVIRAKRSLNLQFSSGYTPIAAGTDNVVLRIPDSPSDGSTLLTFIPREFYVRVETPSAGSSRIQLEKSSGVGAFTLAATGSSYLGGFGITITGAGTYVTSTTSFAGTFLTSGDNLRLNWTLLNATHANFSINLLLEEV